MSNTVLGTRGDKLSLHLSIIGKDIDKEMVRILISQNREKLLDEKLAS